MNNLVKGGTIFAVTLLAVGLTALPGRANNVTCATLATCVATWGTPGSTVTDAPVMNGATQESSFSEATYFNSGTGVWTYYFRLQSNSNYITNVSTGYGPSTSQADNFFSSLDYGVVTDQTDLTSGTTTFSFSPSTLNVILGAQVPINDYFAFYAQSYAGPGAGTFSSLDGGSAYSEAALDPVPEPATLGLLGVGLLGLGLIGIYRKKRLEA